MQNNDKKSKQLKRFKYAQTEKIKQENQLAKTSQQNQIAELATYIYNNICDDYNNIYKEHSPHKYLANKSLFFDISKYNIKVINSVDADKKLNYRIQTHKCYFVDGFWLVIPIYNKYKKDIRNLQFIDNVGNKTMIKYGETVSVYFAINSKNISNKYAIVEGVADALVLSQILDDFNIIVVFSAQQIKDVVGSIVNTEINVEIVIFADYDKDNKVGEIYAIETIKKYGGKYIIPPNEIKDFCDFYTITYRQKHSKKQTINIMKNYIKKLLDKM